MFLLSFFLLFLQILHIHIIYSRFFVFVSAFQRRNRSDMFRSNKQFSLDSRLNMVQNMFFRVNISPLPEFLKSPGSEDDVPGDKSKQFVSLQS